MRYRVTRGGRRRARALGRRRDGRSEQQEGSGTHSPSGFRWTPRTVGRSIVAAANNAFESSHPGWNVDVQYQQWTDHLQKFDATIAGNDTPDVIEMGNTEMTKYMAAGRFTNSRRHKAQFANSGNWLAGLRGLGDVRREALRRAVLRRLAGDHLPHRPVQEGGRQEAAEEPRAVPERSSPRSAR